MRVLTQELLLSSRYADRVPPPVVASLLRALVPAARSSAIMTVEGRGKVPGRSPQWLTDFTDIRLVDVVPFQDSMRFQFEAPPLHDAAPDLLDRADLWHQPPNPASTALDLLGMTINEIGQYEADSDLLDNHVLADVRRFGPLFKADDGTVTFASLPVGNSHPMLSGHTVARAEEMMRLIPDPQPVRLVGKLDMIRDSTRRFGLILDDGTEVPGVYDREMAELLPLFKQRVLVLGKLIYRGSGRPLRVDATSAAAAGAEGAMWSRIPAAVGSLRRKPLHVAQGRRSGIAALIGSWPGDETDEEVERAVAALS